MTHSKDCLYHLEQSFLDCTCGASNATHTRESEFREILAEERDKWDGPSPFAHDAGGLWGWEKIALAAMRRISTPIPLTPSDEMLNAACTAYKGERHMVDRGAMMLALQAALNLMGGKK